VLQTDEKAQIKLGKYLHFKGGIYEVIGIARHSENMEELVIYRSLSDGEIWARPKDMFYGKVMIDGKEIPRFEFIE
jgi:cyclomaltodextrinase